MSRPKGTVMFPNIKTSKVQAIIPTDKKKEFRQVLRMLRKKWKADEKINFPELFQA